MKRRNFQKTGSGRPEPADSLKERIHKTPPVSLGDGRAPPKIVFVRLCDRCGSVYHSTSEHERCADIFRAAVRSRAGLFILALFLCACGPRWTEEDRQGDVAAEALLSRTYALDAGPQVRAYSKGALCAVQQNLVRHDAGRLIGSVQCVEKRE